MDNKTIQKGHAEPTAGFGNNRALQKSQSVFLSLCQVYAKFLHNALNKVPRMLMKLYHDYH